MESENKLAHKEREAACANAEGRADNAPRLSRDRRHDHRL